MAQYFEPMNSDSTSGSLFPEPEMPAAWHGADQALAVRPTSGRRKKGSLAPAPILSALAIFAVLLLQVFNLQTGQPGAVIFPSGISEIEAFDIVIAAGGRPVRPARSAFAGDVIWLAAAEDPAFFARVVRAGAMTVINPFAFGGCLLAQRQ